MENTVKRMPNSKGMTVRVPEEILAEMRAARASIEAAENRTVSLNEIVIRALKAYSTALHCGEESVGVK